MDSTGRNGLSTLQKVTCAFRMLAYGASADSMHEYLRLGESTALECLRHFVKEAAPIAANGSGRAAQLPLTVSTKGKREYLPLRWKPLPTIRYGFGNAFFGLPGSLNDINVLEASPNEIAAGNYPPPIKYVIAGEKRIIPYWLADGIYPNWPMFVHTVSQPANRKEKLMTSLQEASRKDVERAFGILKSKWHMIERPGRLWYKHIMHDVVRCCVILHNMMVENRIVEEDALDGCTDESNLAIFGGTGPLWGNPNSDVSVSMLVPPPGSVAAICALQTLTNNEMEYHRTRKLVMNHYGR